MQPGGRSRHGAGSLRVDGLVALAIGGIVRPVYIRRQRHVTDALEQRQHVLVEGELEQGIVPGDHFSCAATVEQDLRAGLGGLARAHMRQHAAIAGHALDQDLQLAAGSLLAKQPRRNDPRIVEDHQITGPHAVQQIGKVAVRHLP